MMAVESIGLKMVEVVISLTAQRLFLAIQLAAGKTALRRWMKMSEVSNMSQKQFAVGDDFNFLGTVYVIQSFDENGISLKKKPVELLKIEGKLNGASRNPETVIDVWIREDADCTRLLKYKPIDGTYIKATLTIPAPEKKLVKKVMWMAIRKDRLNQTHCYNWVYDTKDEALKAYDDAIGAYPVEVELFAEGE